MKALLKRLLKYLVYLGAGVMIVLAVAVGLFRLFLPRFPEYQDEIKSWASAAIGVQVEFAAMDARWRLRGPELTFQDAELSSPDEPATLLRAAEVSVGVGLLRLLRDRELAADRVYIRDSTIELSLDAGGAWHLQGVPLDELAEFRRGGRQGGGPITVVGEDIRFEFRRPEHTPLVVDVPTLRFRRDEAQQGFAASLELPPALGENLEVAASRRHSVSSSPWQIFVEGEGLDVAGLSRLGPQGWPRSASGDADLSLWVDVGEAGVRSATANFRAAEVTAGEDRSGVSFDAEGRIEYNRTAGGWLLVADNLRLVTPAGSWPQAAMEVRVTGERPDAARTVTGRASWLRLDDLQAFRAWLPARARALIEELEPSGVLQDVVFSLPRSEGDEARYSVSAALDRVGMRASERWPGFSRFSGARRADQSGGRLEIDSVGMTLALDRWLPESVALDRASGTVVWRRNERGTTVLTDNITLANRDFASDSSLQLTLPAAEEPPVIDLRSDFSVHDVARARAYLPERFIKPALYRWLQDALLGGRVPAGTARVSGPLDRFPFDGGEGPFRIEGRLEDGVFLYSDLWPVVEGLDVDLVVDGARLHSTRNAAVNAGNRVVDARIEIPDLRRPVLSIEAQATGTLASIRQFSLASPIAGVFGGHLEGVRAEGPASFDLLLTYPILDRDNYEFTTTIRSDGGDVTIEALPAPVTNLRGAVTITRDSIAAEALEGRFLGEPVAIELARAAPDSPYSVIASARGTVTERGLAEDFGLGFAPELLDGSTAYLATVNFPRANAEDRRPLGLVVDSELRGMAVDLPAPVGKAAGERRALSFTLEFPEEGRIRSRGDLDSELRWDISFMRRDAGWDFDRGMLALGGQEPQEAETRGLHVGGEIELLDFDEWLALTTGGDGPGVGERIRSIDLQIGELTILGQQLDRHHVVVNRSALDWAARIDGGEIRGSLSIPYDFDSGRALVLDMERLLLPAAAEETAAGPQREAARDPRRLPPITVRAAEFALGQRRFGRLEAEFVRTGSGLAGSIESRSESFHVSGNGGWLVDETDPAGQRSFLTARLASGNVQQTLRELDYLSGIESELLRAEFDVSWSGGPRHDFLDSLDGTVAVEFGTGRLDDVEPGAGRVFGLMSIVALPRRLSLDFRDVFDKGFGFDAITGTFRLVDGQAYTCDLSLKGPAADVGIVGKAGLTDKQYEQAAVVSANVGNTLPVVGAVVAGPQVAAALLIFSQIFKKPLQEMGQVYYDIHGSWQEPAIESSDAQTFAATSAMAGCLDAAR